MEQVPGGGITFAESDVQAATTLFGLVKIAKFGVETGLTAHDLMEARKALIWLPEMIQRMKDNVLELGKVRETAPELPEPPKPTPIRARKGK